MIDPNPGAPPARTKRVPRRAQAALGVLVLIALIVLTAYALRRAIGESLVAGYLRSHGFESVVAVDRLTSHGVSGRLRLGPGADPNASAERVELDLTVAPPWSPTPFQVVVHRIRLVRPYLKLAYQDGKLSIGGLERLIPPPRPGAPPSPLPDVVVEDGTAKFATPAGDLLLRGSGEIHGGRPTAMDLRAAPARLGGPGWSAATGEAHLVLTTRGEAMSAVLEAPIIQLAGKGVQFAGGDLSLRFNGAYPAAAPIAVKGALTGRLVAASGALGGASASGLALDVTAPSLALANQDRAWRLTGQGTASATAAGVATVNASLRAVRAKLDAPAFDLTFGSDGARGQVRGNATVSSDSGVAKLASASVQLRTSAANGQGSLTLSPAGASLDATGGLSARAGLTAADARTLARAVNDPAYERAFAAALRDFKISAPRLTLSVSPKASRLGLGAPLQLTSASRARLGLIPIGGRAIAVSKNGSVSGAASLNLAGGGMPTVQVQLTDYTYARGALDARGTLRAVALDFAPVRAVNLDASGRLRVGGGTVSFAPAACIPLAAERVELGESPIIAPAGKLCPVAGAPLFALGGQGWRFTGRFEDAAAQLPSLKVRADHLSARVEATGGVRRALSADVQLDRAELFDTSAQPWFRPLSGGGQAKLSGDLLHGVFAVSTAANRPIGQVTVDHRVSTGEGQALLDAPKVHFVRDGLQPSELSPLGDSIRRAEGDVRFKGQVHWTKRGLTSSGDVSTEALNIASPIGATSGVAADVHLTSLVPLVTAPGQVVTAQKVAAVVPLEAVRLEFSLDDRRFDIQSGRLAAAGGEVRLEPLQVVFESGQTVQGALVLDHIDLGKIVAATNLADKVQLDAVVDGRLPFQFGPDGLKLLKGSIAAVKPGRLAIRREVFVGVTQPNAVQDLAYQAMAAMAFDTFTADVGSRPEGRLGVVFHIKGRHDPAVAREAYVSVRGLMDGSALQKSIPLPKDTPIDLTLDTSLNFEQLLDDYQKAISLGRSGSPLASRSVSVQP